MIMSTDSVPECAAAETVDTIVVTAPLLITALLKLKNKGTWCSWLSRSLSISEENLREGSGSIPDVSIFPTLHSPRTRLVLGRIKEFHSESLGTSMP